MLIYQNDGSPFKNQHGAKITAGRKHIKKYSVITVDGGYAIETDEVVAVPEVKSSPVQADASETQEITPMSAKEETVEEVAVPKKKHAVTTPWKPSSFIDIPKHLKEPGYRYRWCKKDKPGNIEKKQAEGWEIDMELTKKMKRLPATVHDGTPIDTTFHVRELIVMRIPEEIAKARDKYYSDRASAASKSAKQKFRKDASDLTQGYGGGAYGDIEETRH